MVKEAQAYLENAKTRLRSQMKNVQEDSHAIIMRERQDKKRKAAGQEPIPYQKEENDR
jgi:hypothetical protein